MESLNSNQVDLAKLLRDKAYEYKEVPFNLSAGGKSHDYVDLRRGLSNGSDLKLVAETAVQMIEAFGYSFANPNGKQNSLSKSINAVGGLTMGADPISHAISIITGISWFSVRKEAKSHGKMRQIEGVHLNSTSNVLLVDDVVSTGRSIFDAIDSVRASNANIVLAMSILDRGDITKALCKKEEINYISLCTYSDIGIEPLT